jgi:site-specific DNA-methyltransferase (adenine-specific)
MKLYNGDALEIMDKLIADGVKVDAVITDPPYGITQNKWDSVIPFDEMWSRLDKLNKENGATVLFGSQPFTSALIMSNINDYRYNWVWEKQYATNFMGAKNAPLKYHEDIIVFSKNKHFYNPIKYKAIEIDDIMNLSKTQMNDFMVNREYDKFSKIDKRKTVNDVMQGKDGYLGVIDRVRNVDNGYRYPKSVIKINGNKNKSVHPTQKPVELMEYLIKTYTNEGDVVLDFTMGSGTTGVAALNLNRDFIGIELDKNHYDISVKRITEAEKKMKMSNDLKEEW